jgi:hypothetical protein
MLLLLNMPAYQISVLVSRRLLVSNYSICNVKERVLLGWTKRDEEMAGSRKGPNAR